LENYLERSSIFLDILKINRIKTAQIEATIPIRATEFLLLNKFV